MRACTASAYRSMRARIRAALLIIAVMLSCEVEAGCMAVGAAGIGRLRELVREHVTHHQMSLNATEKAHVTVSTHSRPFHYSVCSSPTPSVSIPTVSDIAPR